MCIRDRAGQIQGHRHHAGGAKLRSVPALRCAYVSRRREGVEDPPFSDVRRAAPVSYTHLDVYKRQVHDGCDRAGYYEQGDFAEVYGSPKCIVKLGCWGPVVNCNVPKRGWMAGIGGCPNVGGICIGCTMPGFPDKFMPFMDEPPGARVSTASIGVYGRAIRALRAVTQNTVNKEPKWRHPRAELTTGYHPRSY